MTDQPDQPENGAAQKSLVGWADRVKVQGGALAFQTAGDLAQFCLEASRTGLVPKGMSDPRQAFLVAIAGQDFGLSPFQAWQSMAVINGRPTPHSDLTPHRWDTWENAVDREEWWEVDGKRAERRPRGIKPGDDVEAVCRLTYKRPDGEEKTIEGTFHLSEAEDAGLYPAVDRHGQTSEKSPWNRYTARMLQWKARNWAIRDAYPNALKGYQDQSEAREIAGFDGARDAEAEVVDQPIEGAIDLSQVADATGDGDQGDARQRDEDAAFEQFRQTGQLGGEEDPPASGKAGPETRDPAAGGSASADPSDGHPDYIGGAGSVSLGGAVREDLATVMAHQRDPSDAETHAEIQTRNVLEEALEEAGLDPDLWEVVGVGPMTGPNRNDPPEWLELRHASDPIETRIALVDGKWTRTTATNQPAAEVDQGDAEAAVAALPWEQTASVDQLKARLEELLAGLGMSRKDLRAFVAERMPGKTPSNLSKAELGRVVADLGATLNPAHGG